MSTDLGSVIAAARNEKGWSLRRTGDETGIHNAHLSQIETGTIKQPSQPMLYAISQALDLDFDLLLDLAGHTTSGQTPTGRRSLAGAMLRTIEDIDLDEDGQRELLELLEKHRRKKKT